MRVLGSRSVEVRFADTGSVFRNFARTPEFDPSRGRGIEDQLPFIMELLFGPSAGEDLLEELEREPADALVVDCMLLGSLAAAESSGLPAATLIHFLHGAAVSGERAFAKRWQAGLPIVEHSRSVFGLKSLSGKGSFLDEIWGRAAVALLVTPEEFDERGLHRPLNFRYVGPFFDPVEGWSWDFPWPADHVDPLVVVAFSTTYMQQEKRLTNVAAALGALPVRGLLTLGPELHDEEVEAPPNVIVRQWVPHAVVLPFASAVVTHGGHSTVMAALAHGVPLLCMPMGRDQHHVAERVEACGVGLVLLRDAQATDIRTAVERVISTVRYREAARRMAEIIKGYGNGSRAVKELENLVLHRIA